MENWEKITLGVLFIGVGAGAYFLLKGKADKSGNPIIDLKGDTTISDGDGTREEFDRCSKYILEIWENKYVKNAFEESKFAICKEWYPQENIILMTLPRAQEIIYADYWVKYNIHKLPFMLRMIVLDAAINQGQPTSIRMLQELAGVKVDGINGLMTQEAAKNVTMTEYVARRKQQYHTSAMLKGRDQFLEGWLNRLADVEKEAMYYI